MKHYEMSYRNAPYVKYITALDASVEGWPMMRSSQVAELEERDSVQPEKIDYEGGSVERRE